MNFDLAGKINDLVTEIKRLPTVGMESVENISPVFEMSIKDIKEGVGKLTAVPDIAISSIVTQVASAGARLRIFTALTYAVAVILLALAGFVELYVTRSDFGSKNVADYFGLLAWGFGAEATRAAITDMVKSWGVIRK